MLQISDYLSMTMWRKTSFVSFGFVFNWLSVSYSIAYLYIYMIYDIFI
jgi:hypothetical protein